MNINQDYIDILTRQMRKDYPQLKHLTDKRLYELYKLWLNDRRSIHFLKFALDYEQ